MPNTKVAGEDGALDVDMNVAIAAFAADAVAAEGKGLGDNVRKHLNSHAMLRVVAAGNGGCVARRARHVFNVRAHKRGLVV